MREIEFRGIPLFGESFVYGSLIIEPNERGEDTYIIRRYENGSVCCFEVKKETVGQYTGLKDTDNNKIYADSSICRVNYFSSSDWISDYCYFSFDTENLRYTVHLINEREIVDYEASYFDCIETVDTIQENNLGLIVACEGEV